MDRPTVNKLRYYLRLHYPVRVVAAEEGFRGHFPDLPGCHCAGDDLSTLYATLEHQRRHWITAQVIDGHCVPLPNSHAQSSTTAAARS